uniref:Zinc finger PHD-type domain-containing protein n=2 Tax=Trichobilharzia regenti TaxID=157069 RepID=A0AA85JJB8_TRIRE|nr:unnamed protein product [Trichobilharzia regenti]
MHDPFVRRFQPELFGDWKLGKNPRPHPLDAYMIKDINRLSEDTIHPDSKSLKADLRRVASGSSAPVERPPFKLKLPRPGDLNLIDLRYSSKQFKEAKLPYHIAANPHLYHLWCGNPANEQNERTFNNFIGSHKPHCAICSFLWTPQHISKLLSTEHRDKNLPMYSDPHLPEVAYHDFHSSSVQFPQAVKSRIIRCLHCSLTVHTRCYGIKDETLLNEDSSVTEKISWICDACKADGKPTCVFCYMRGGAMKALMNINNSYTGRPYWAHVICALATPGCHFKDVPQRLAFISEDTIKTAINSAELYYNVRNDRNAICENNFPMEMRQSDSTRFANSNNIAKNLRLAHKRPHDSNSYGECYGNGLRECSQTSQESGVYGKNKASHFSRKLCRNQTVVIYPSVGSLKLSNRHNKDLLSSDDDSDHHSHHRKTDITTKSEKIATLFSSKCTVCGLPGRGFLPLAPCWYDGCPARFHVTCAQMAGIVIGTDVYPRFFYIACRKHPTNYSHPGFRDQDSVSPGDNVMVQRNRNLIFSPAVAIRRVTPPYCRISFPDGTFSSDTPPEYLTNIDWSKDGPPTKGSIVKVLWDDGIEYVGTFEGTTSEQWEVQLESGEVKVFNREQFYVQPKKKCKQSVDLNDDSDDNSLRPSCS